MDYSNPELTAAELASLIASLLASETSEADRARAVEDAAACNFSAGAFGDKLVVTFGGATGLMLGEYEIVIRKTDRARVDVDDVRCKWLCVVYTAYRVNTPEEVEIAIAALDAAGQACAVVRIGKFDDPARSTVTKEIVYGKAPL